MRYKIKHLSILLLICIAALYMPFYASASAVPQIEGSVISAQAGEHVDVVFNISFAENVCGGNFNIVYNTEYLQIVGAKAGDVFKDSSPVINTKYETGKVRVTWAGITPIEESGELITASFLVKKGAPSGELAVNIEGLRLYDYDVQVIKAEVVSAKVNVKNTYLVMIPENNGDKISVSVNFESDNSLMGGNFVLAYDNSALTPVSVGKGPLLTGATVTSNLSYTSNTVKVSWAGINAVRENGEIFKLIFDVVEGFTGPVTFTINNSTLYDENSTALIVQTNDATLNIEETVAQTPLITVGTVKCCDEGTLAVSIEKNSMICGGGFEIVYDNTAVEIVDVAFGETLVGKTPILNSAYEPNVIKLSWASALPMTVAGDILNISFKIIDTSKKFADFSIQNLNLYDANMKPVTGEYKNGGVIIFGENDDYATSTTFTKDGESLVFESHIYSAPDEGILYIALYKEGKMVACEIQDVANTDYAKIIIDACDFDTGKVMLWENETSLAPLSKAGLFENN